MEVGGVLTYEGSNFFRQRLVLSTLSGKPVRIRKIRATSEEPGLTDYEVSFIRLLDCLNNGSQIEVNETGTAILYKPGVLAGGIVEHTCPRSRGIGYFLEPLMMLAPFCKKPINATLLGITNNQIDPSVDMIRSSLLPVLKKFVLGENDPEVKLVKRGLPPAGAGRVVFCCPVKRSLTAFQWLESGQVKRIRGVAYTSRVAPTVANRMLEVAKGVFLKYLTDVYFSVDNAKGACPGYGLCALAVTNKGTYLSAEAQSSSPGSGQATSTAEEVGRAAAMALLEEVWRGGCVDSQSQPLVTLFMALGPKDVSKVTLGPLTPYTMHFLRHLRDFFQITFKIDEKKEIAVAVADDEDNDSSGSSKTGAPKLVLTCVGSGYTNVGKGQT